MYELTYVWTKKIALLFHPSTLTSLCHSSKHYLLLVIVPTGLFSIACTHTVCFGGDLFKWLILGEEDRTVFLKEKLKYHKRKCIYLFAFKNIYQSIDNWGSSRKLSISRIFICVEWSCCPAEKHLSLFIVSAYMP